MAEKSEEPRKAKLQFNYIKGPTYREVLCNGAIGGVTPQGYLWMALYAERPPIPRIVEFEIAPTVDGTIVFNEKDATPSLIEGRHGVVRHVEVMTYMDLDTARRVYTWLGQHIQNLEVQKARS